MFNKRIYSKDSTIPYTDVNISNKSKGRYKKPPNINESNLDTDRLLVRGIKDDSRMNRAVFNMKPNNVHNIIDSSKCNKQNDKEQYCCLHQKYARVRNMNDLIGSQPLDNQISQLNKMKLRNEFEQSVEGFLSSLRNSFDVQSKANKNNILKDYQYDNSSMFNNEQASKGCGCSNKEAYTANFANTADDIYLLNIRSNIESILRVLENVECFQDYKSYWKDLRNGLIANRWNINILPINDKDIAYSLNKGQELNFKTKDSNEYLPMKIMIYVLCHELAHVACVNEKDHTETFSFIMWLIECAAFMAGLLKPNSIPTHRIKFSNQSIVDRATVKDELTIGFMYLRKSNKNIDYIDAVLKYLKFI